MGILAIGCASPRDRAARADARANAGIYTWLLEHDPSAVSIAGLDEALVRAVAPDARVRADTISAAACARALKAHALLAALAPLGSRERGRLEDCGFALFHDRNSIVVVPR